MMMGYYIYHSNSWVIADYAIFVDSDDYLHDMDYWVIPVRGS
jgi:hypothetical protein